MKFLGEVFPVDEKDISTKEFKIRKKAVGIMMQDGKIAMVFFSKNNIYSLPGGGVDSGESLEEAVKRELIEETGFEVEISKEVGMTIDYLYDFNIIQFSYCYLVDIKNNTFKQSLTDSEIESGMVVEWVEVKDVINKILQNEESNIGDTVLKKRTQIFLKEVLGITT